MSGPFKKIVFDAHTSSLDEFESHVAAAAAAGVTHVNISRQVRRARYVDRDDERNPWTEWAVMYASLFKHYTGPELEGVYDPEFLRENVEVLRKKHEIVVRHGLRGIYHCNEPMFLPNKVYLKHPGWRGGRGDNSLRTRDWLCSPCVDNPEVLDLYRRIVRDVVQIAPSIDTFTFSANDAGSCLCWSERMYVPRNGPEACKRRNMGDRVTGFLKAVRQGAADGGVDAWAYFLGWFSQAERTQIVPKLEPGIGMGGSPDPAKPRESFVGGGGTWTPWDTPVEKLAHPFRFVAGFDRARKTGQWAVKMSWYLGHTDPATFTALRVFSEIEPGSMDTLRGRINAVEKIAAELFAPVVAERVMEAWNEIRLAQEIFSATGHSMGMSAYANRWLVRPILGTQDGLTAEELDYCMRWIYQIDPDGWRHYLLTHRHHLAEQWQHAVEFASVCGRAVMHLRRAASMLRGAKEDAPDDTVRDKLELDALRADALRCMILTCSHTMQLGVIALEREKVADRYTAEVDPAQPTHWEGSAQLTEIYRLQRAELDNTYELIDLLERAPEPLIVSEPEKSDEGYFRYGPDLIEQLRTKAELTVKHWRDADRLYFMPKAGS